MLTQKQIKEIEDLTGHKNIKAEDNDVLIFSKLIVDGPKEWNAHYQLDIYCDDDGKPQKITYSYCPHSYRFEQEPIPVKWLLPLAKILEDK